MVTKHMLAVVGAMTLVGSGVALSAQGDQSAQQRLEQQMGSEGNAMGVPVPGSVSDMEKTEKQPDMSKIQSSKSIPRLPYTVEGEILKIDGENFDIRSGQGERVSLIVNRDTNLDCAAAPSGGESGRGKQSETITTDRLSRKDQAPKASEQQLTQGQRQDETARGAGFRIGTCDFKTGDRVRAQIDDNGNVTTLKYLAKGSDQGSSMTR